MKTHQQKITDHYEKCWTGSAVPHLWGKGPIHKLPEDFRVLEFAPQSERNMWTYATCCMSQPGDENPIELHLYSSVRNEMLVELLTVTAYFHISTAKLNLHHTVNFGQPWQHGSLCSYGLISLPYIDGPSLENGPAIKCYWLIAITPEELSYKKEYGVDALEDKFEEGGIDYANPFRKSLI